jgi:hypothetical protein
MVVFAEELGEIATELLGLQQQVFKALRFGIDEQRDLPTSNRERIEAEWQDLLGAVEKLREVGINLKPDIGAIQAKMRKIDEYSAYAQSLGTLHDEPNRTAESA